MYHPSAGESGVSERNSKRPVPGAVEVGSVGGLSVFKGDDGVVLGAGAVCDDGGTVVRGFAVGIVARVADAAGVVGACGPDGGLGHGAAL